MRLAEYPIVSLVGPLALFGVPKLQDAFMHDGGAAEAKAGHWRSLTFIPSDVVIEQVCV